MAYNLLPPGETGAYRIKLDESQNVKFQKLKKKYQELYSDELAGKEYPADKLLVKLIEIALDNIALDRKDRAPATKSSR